MSDNDPQRPQILVVDDESIVVSLVKDALEDEDMVVEGVLTPDEALQCIARQTFDLIITDIRMPGMDGIELVRRAHESQPDLGVIFMTGYANLASAKNAIKQGAFDYIMKPFELSEIRQAVRNAIKIRGEVAAKSSEHELTRLSDLSEMLFTANERVPLITSSLKFIMMHQHSDCGSVLLRDKADEDCVEVSICGKDERRTTHSHSADIDAVIRTHFDELRYPLIISSLEDHPVYARNPKPELKPFLRPPWAKDGQPVVWVPIVRSSVMFGWLVLSIAGEAASIKEADLKFLAITASQLAITLENLALLEETQKAYANLKELQDETIRLETIATRGQMSAEIGHEMNNFIGVVAGNLSLLDFHIRKGTTKDLGKYVSAMTETIEKIKKFTANLMDLTPISSEKAVLSFDRLLSEVIDYLRPQKRFRDVKVQVTNLPADLPLEADTTQMQQLLYNIFNNAADAMVESPRKEITVSVERIEQEGRFRFSVTDTGCGIPKELLEKAFQERFTTKKTGHGFGLVVCKRIIQNHGGLLQVDSTPGLGTTIGIRFPIAGMKQPEEPTAREKKKASEEQVMIPSSVGFRVG